MKITQTAVFQRATMHFWNEYSNVNFLFKFFVFKVRSKRFISFVPIIESFSKAFEAFLKSI